MLLPLLLAPSLLAACGPATSATDGGDGEGAEDAAPRDAAERDAGSRSWRVASVTNLGALPLPSDAAVGRDGASAGLLGGQLLWTFGDTFLTVTSPVDGSHVVSATSAWATPEEPLALVQPVDDDGVPAQLIPYTDEELAMNRAAPLDGWALWPGAAIDTGGDALLVLFQRIKRTAGSGFDGVGLGTARIAPGERVARRGGEDLFSRPLGGAGGEPLFGAAGVTVEGETAYFFACEQAGLGADCRLARVPRARADERAAFEFYDGAGWSADIEDAAVVVRGVGAAISVHHNAYLGGYLMVTSPVFSNDVALRVAERIEGPWPRASVVVHADDVGILSAGEGFNYLAQEQPALLRADGREIVISYSRPLGSFRGEVRLSRITFE